MTLDPSVRWCWWCHTHARLLPAESDLPRCERCLDRTPRRASDLSDLAAAGRLLPKDEATLRELIEIWNRPDSAAVPRA